MSEQLKYQIFVSSTFTDLQEERNLISKAILDLGHIPAGMELFPAADTEQFTYIKKVIDECDYYLLIIGGRYGSVSSAGLSYTELEYNYAKSKCLPVLAFIHDEVGSIPFEKSEVQESARIKLQAFRDEVKSGRLVQFWSTPENLQSRSIISLSRAFKDQPQVGWVRSTQTSSREALIELVNLQKENAALRATLLEAEQQKPGESTDLADLEAQYVFRFKKARHWQHSRTSYEDQDVTLTLKEFLVAVAREFHTASTLPRASTGLDRYLTEDKGMIGSFSSFNQTDLEKALMQLVALKMMRLFASKTVQGGQASFFQLTPAGQNTWLSLRTRQA